jgi:4-hydroxy-tetrahydrodipicolinate synthase
MKFRTDPAQFRGSIAPIITPFNDDGALDLQSLRGLVRCQLDSGSHGMPIGGSTGGPSAQLTAERLQAIHAVADEVGDAVHSVRHRLNKMDETLELTVGARS